MINLKFSFGWILCYFKIMPAKNRRKSYLENGYYHLYNRGVEKRKIFLDQEDYFVFLSYLKEYLLPKNEKELSEKLNNPKTSYKEKDKVLKLLNLNNFSKEIKLIAYCLMPNHFHFFVKQNHSNSIDRFMNSVFTRYSMYFNRKYKRVGSLFQGVYKAVLVESDGQFLHLSKYIHKQAIRLNTPSSYEDYLGFRKTEWVDPGEVLNNFSNEYSKLSYEDFVKEFNDFEKIENLIIED